MVKEQSFRVISTQDFSQFNTGITKDWYGVATDSHFWMQWRMRVLQRALADVGLLGGSTALHGVDVGCGTGVLRRQIESFTDWTIDGTELDGTALSLNEPTRGSLYLYDIGKRDAEFEQKYDVITMFDILEHFSDAEKFLKDAIFHLKEGGYCVINVPALDSFRSRYDDIAGHELRYSKSVLRQQLESVGLKVIDIRYWGLSLIPPCWLRRFLDLVYDEDIEIILKGFEPPGKLVHDFFKLIGQTETTLLPRAPIGTSLMAIAQKSA